jgi:hypothetical protein
MTDLDDIQTPAHLAGGAYESTVRSKATELKQVLINQTLEDIESWGKAVDDQWAQAHPGQSHTSPTTTAEYKQYVSTVQNGYYDWVEPAFERYLTPDPDAINPMISAMRKIEGMFHGSTDGAGSTNFASPALARTHDVRGDIGHWQGGFQEDFIDNFLTPLETVSINQGTVAKAVRSQLLCGKGMYIEYRDGILKLLDRSIEAVRLLNNQRDPKPCLWGTLVGISLGLPQGGGPPGRAVAEGSPPAHPHGLHPLCARAVVLRAGRGDQHLQTLRRAALTSRKLKVPAPGSVGPRSKEEGGRPAGPPRGRGGAVRH